MKHHLAAIFAIVMIPIASCANSGAVKEVKGYPVYKFMNFGGIDAKALKTNESVMKQLLGKNYGTYLERHQLFVSRGFSLYTPLNIQMETGKEVEVYVRNKDYEDLWKISPLDLAKQKQSHLARIKYRLLVIFGGNSCGNPLGCQTLADAKHRFLPSDSWIGVPLECWES